ncbi:hypothetical protein TKK_0004681 [Trichogramma kaykai]
MIYHTGHAFLHYKHSDGQEGLLGAALGCADGLEEDGRGAAAERRRNPNSPDADGSTPLQLAVANLQPDIIDLLLLNGVDLLRFAYPSASHMDCERPFRRSGLLRASRGTRHEATSCDEVTVPRRWRENFSSSAISAAEPGGGRSSRRKRKRPSSLRACHYARPDRDADLGGDETARGFCAPPDCGGSATGTANFLTGRCAR